MTGSSEALQADGRTIPNLVPFGAIETIRSRTDMEAGLDKTHEGVAEQGWNPERIEALVADNARLRGAVAARDSFLAVAAHELRNPMTPILGRVTLLRRAVERGNVSLEHVNAGLERIEQLVVHFIKRATTLLDVARADADCMPVERHPVNVSQLILDIAENYRPAAVHAGSTLDAEVSPDLVVCGDRQAIEQVLENLVSNAIKYGAASPIRIDAVAFPDQALAVVRVSDAGPGIPLPSQARIFERYERAQESGSEVIGFGVGLWIVRRLCESMGGRIELRSSPGEGATFSVSLPLQSSMDMT